MALPLVEGSLNFPSLAHRKAAYDLKLLKDLTQGDQTILWKVWTHVDLRQASTARPSTRKSNPNCHAPREKHLNLDPTLQRTYTKYGSLEPHVWHTVAAAWRARMNIQSCLPSPPAQSSAPAMYHHALSGTTLCGDLEARGITMVGELVCPTVSGCQAGRFVCKTPMEYNISENKSTNLYCVTPWEAPPRDQNTRLSLLNSLLLTDWHPQVDHQANSWPLGKLAVWQTQVDIRDCLRIHTGLRSILTLRSSTAGPRNS